MCVGNRRPRRRLADGAPVPVHGLAGAGRAQERGGIHRLLRTSAQDQGAIWTGWTYYCTLQVIYSFR